MRPIKVSELSFYMERILAKDAILQCLEVEGEITNVRKSRFLYFDLKDQKALVHCISFDPQRDFPMAGEGEKAIVRGRISLYHPGGRLQITVSGIAPAGLSQEALRFLALKNKLEKEGLFDQDRKKPIPSMPRTIGLVTSASGAVLHDFANEAYRRFPLVKLLLARASVQGKDAPGEIIQALDQLESYREDFPLDLIVIARGGGSGVDLSCFNDESLVRRVFCCKLPVISAIGHQVDYTLLDLVSDRRASTPTEAAILALPDQNQLFQQIDDLQLAAAQRAFARMKEIRLSILQEEKAIEALHPSRKINRERKESGLLFLQIRQKFQETIYRKRQILQAETVQISRTFSQRVEEVNQKLKKGPLTLSLFSQAGKAIGSDREVSVGSLYRLRSVDYSYLIRIEEKERNSKNHDGKAKGES